MAGRGEACYVAKGAWQGQHGARGECTGEVWVCREEVGRGFSGTEAREVDPVGLERAVFLCHPLGWAVPMGSPSTLASSPLSVLHAAGRGAIGNAELTKLLPC